jgi:hypothetical protein
MFFDLLLLCLYFYEFLPMPILRKRAEIYIR